MLCWFFLSYFGRDNSFKISTFLMVNILIEWLILIIIYSLRPLDAESVKDFLMNYNFCCFEDGLTLIQDNYQPFYEVLSTRMDYPEDYVIHVGSMNLQANPIISIQGGHQVDASNAIKGMPQ